MIEIIQTLLESQSLAPQSSCIEATDANPTPKIAIRVNRCLNRICSFQISYNGSNITKMSELILNAACARYAAGRLTQTAVGKAASFKSQLAATGLQENTMMRTPAIA
tara:strand:- start:249 stop:572 length:324 start_codon:yes stop_codon:yes gene_type:complete